MGIVWRCGGVAIGAKQSGIAHGRRLLLECRAPGLGAAGQAYSVPYAALALYEGWALAAGTDADLHRSFPQLQQGLHRQHANPRSAQLSGGVSEVIGWATPVASNLIAVAW